MKYKLLVFPVTLLFLTASSAFSQTALFWDADGAAGIGGTGAWDTTSTLWNTANSGAANSTWNNAVSTFASFGGTAGTVTVDAGGVTTRGVNASNNGALGFDTGGYSLTGGTITVLSTVADANVVVVRGGTTTNIANNIAITPVNGTTGDFIRLVHQRVNNSHVTFGGNIGMAAGVTSGVQRLDFIAGGGATGTQSTLNGVISNYLGAGTGGTLQIRVGVNGAGTSPIVNLNGNNTFTSGVIVGDGIVNVGHNNALGTAAFTFGTGGIGAGSVGQLLTSSAVTISNAISMTGQANQAGMIIGVGGAHSSTFSGTITNDATQNTTALTLRAATGGTATFSGLISDGTNTKNVVKDGSGTVVLSRAAGNTYDGTTTVSAGTLLANNTSGSATGTNTVSVSSSGTLGGTGLVSGAVNVTGVLAPGVGIESLGTGALSFITGSNYAYELNTSALNGDLAYSSGTLDIAAGSILSLTDLAASTGLSAGSKLTLISYFGGWTSGELFTYNAATLADDSTFTLGANQWRFDYNDTTAGSNFAGDITGATHFVTMTVIPEPNVAMLMGGVGMLALLRRRKVN